MHLIVLLWIGLLAALAPTQSLAKSGCNLLCTDAQLTPSVAFIDLFPLIDLRFDCKRAPVKQNGSEDHHPCGFVHREKADRDRHWVWRSGSGEVISSTKRGIYRLYEGGDCLRSFCRIVECDIVEWPRFKCDDGTTRSGRAPDFNTFVFGGVTYERVLKGD